MSWVDDYNVCIRQELLKWLAAKGPADWDKVAKEKNWDSGVEELSWIVSQDECDAGTAQYLFWLAGPSYFTDEQLGARDSGRYFPQANYHMILTIAERWAAGKYKTQDFGEYAHLSGSGLINLGAGTRVNRELVIPQGIDSPTTGESSNFEYDPKRIMEEMLAAENGQFEEGIPYEVLDLCASRHRPSD
ncbi:DUF4274 domain-containing protein [Erythrobacter mangrovi]|uniref:DUF4274 domain-containing protein n=1 Tax=Erythrobacter mangrovi TaxID=2739433 RepID=A0A7D4BAG7_9SPHN|nr:DUF4274 domain-containing protein [Erythrobacter mangrovi]QKG70966.1 DUF4274 domain-containing protein [Erythrobacter mangrovi]